ncbi:MAG: MerR family transcriptional regulator [Clostridia bacterium]|nr:MerR family transcriptional regulator [Clostridia bacterium]MBR3592393.1 MerR family transcriptional regulator [Clostridia bacterium]
MKMKEVLEKTGLTDRAVRLYIENSLVVPSIEESYSGRKNIEFSAEDVQCLKNIALLRKIGFSIPDIKSISQGGETAKEAIEKFISQKQNSIEHDTLVVSQLQKISFENDLSIESLCSQLESAAENKEVPKEDLQLSWIEKLETKGIDFWGIINIVAAILAGILFVVFFIVGSVHFIFTAENTKIFLSGLACFAPMLILGVLIVILNRIKTVVKKCKLLIRISYAFCALIIVPCWICLGIVSLICLWFSESYTDDPADYLVLDNWVESNFSEEIELIFPDEIPESALSTEHSYNTHFYPFTTEYYYFYNHILDPCIEIIGQWTLPKDEFNKEILRIEKINTEKTVVEKGDWVCYYFADTEEYQRWDSKTYTFIIFAYNDESSAVRYIVSHCVDAYATGPVYLDMVW